MKRTESEILWDNAYDYSRVKDDKKADAGKGEKKDGDEKSDEVVVS